MNWLQMQAIKAKLATLKPLYERHEISAAEIFTDIPDLWAYIHRLEEVQEQYDLITMKKVISQYLPLGKVPDDFSREELLHMLEAILRHAEVIVKTRRQNSVT